MPKLTQMKLLKAIGCAAVLAAASCMALAAEDRIDIVNVEDIAVLDGARWAIASSMSGGVQAAGALYAIDTGSQRVQQLYPLASQPGTSEMAQCAAPVTAAAFAPHGIALHTDASGAQRLYAVNHGGRESLEVFSVTGNLAQNNAPQLRWVGCIPLPKGAFGNSVAIAADGTLYLTNMGQPLDGSAAISPMGGEVIAWTAESGWRSLPGSAIAAPNGLLVSADGRELFVASWSQGELVKLTREGKSVQRQVMKLSFLPDNLRWGRTGTVLAAGHRTTTAAVTECFLTEGRCAKVIASAIAEIDPQSLAVRCVRGVDQSMATVAVNVGAELWIGTARGENILRLPADALEPMHCDKSLQ